MALGSPKKSARKIVKCRKNFSPDSEALRSASLHFVPLNQSFTLHLIPLSLFWGAIYIAPLKAGRIERRSHSFGKIN